MSRVYGKAIIIVITIFFDKTTLILHFEVSIKTSL